MPGFGGGFGVWFAIALMEVPARLSNGASLRSSLAARQLTKPVPQVAALKSLPNGTKAEFVVTALPVGPEVGHLYEINKSPDPHHAWHCLQVRRSRIPGAGKGVFAVCPLQNQTLLGEYLGQRFLMGEHGANLRLKADWSYIWKVPRCLAEEKNLVVIRREDKHSSHACSNNNGFVYVDAKPLVDERGNPLRYVNGVHPNAEMQVGQPTKPNVEVFFADDRVFYHTAYPVAVGEELLVNYGDGYWRSGEEAKQPPEEMGIDMADFMTDM